MYYLLQTLIFTSRLIKKRPLRSLLTIIQIALGVWIVTTILTMNFQANDRIEATLNKFGENIARISLEREQIIDGMRVPTELGNFSSEDISRLHAESSSIESVFVYNSTWQTRVKHNDLLYNLRGMAEVSAEAIPALDLNIIEGFAFTTQDVEQNNQVVVVSSDLGNQLYPNQSAIGKHVEIQSVFGRDDFITYEIIGVYEPIDPILTMFFDEATMLIPLGSRESTAERELVYTPFYHQLYIKSHPGAAFAAVEEAQLIFGDDDFNVRAFYLSEYGNTFTSMINQMSMILGAFAFVAIIISSLGILSIMLVNVVERTREIGLRKALGASKSSIIRQILNESFMFSLLGALIGIIASFLSSGYVINGLLNQAFYLSIGDLGQLHPTAAIYSGIMALVLGLVFGLYPAVQAAKMPAVEALRDA